MVAVSGNTLVNGRPREHNGTSTEFKFVFKSYSGVVARTTDLVALMSSLSKMRTGTTERIAAEKDKSKRKGNENPKGSSQSCVTTAEMGSQRTQLLARKRETGYPSSKQFVVYAGGHRCSHKKELGLLESGSENAE